MEHTNERLAEALADVRHLHECMEQVKSDVRELREDMQRRAIEYASDRGKLTFAFTLVMIVVNSLTAWAIKVALER